MQVCRFDGSNRFAVVHKNLDKPRGMALYPMKGYMFWTDWGFRNPKIERALLDGSDRMELVNRTVLRDIGWPNGLAIDYTSSLVYWTDAKIRLIYRMDLDGGNSSIHLYLRALFYSLSLNQLYDFLRLCIMICLGKFIQCLCWTSLSNVFVIRTNVPSKLVIATT